MVTKQSILAKFNIKCNWQHYTCKEIQNDIISYINSGHVLDSEFLTAYIIFLGGSDTSYYNYNCCKHNINNWVTAFSSIANKITLSLEQMLFLISYGQYPDVVNIFKHIVASGHKIPLEVFKATLALGVSSGLTTFLCHHCVADQECLELASVMHASVESNTVFELLINQKIPITPTVVKNVIKHKSLECVNSLLQLGIIPDLECLKEACTRKDYLMIDKILQYRITPTKECLDNVFANGGYNHYSGRVYENPHCKNIASIIDLLIANGYQLTYDDVLTALTKGLYINDIERFGFEFDDRLLETCAAYSYYPYPDLPLKHTIKCLEIECGKSGNLPAIRKLVKQGVLPNMTCLENACNHKSNKSVVEYLINKCDMRPNAKCFQNIAKHIYNATLTLLADNLTLNTVEKGGMGVVDDEVEEVAEATNEVATEVADSEEPQEVVVEDTVPEQAVAVEKVDDKFDVIELKYNQKNLPTNKRKKEVVADKILNLFKYKKDVKLSFINVRKELLAYIKRHNLLVGDGNKYIMLNKSLAEAVGLDDNDGKCVDVNDIDILASHFYK